MNENTQKRRLLQKISDAGRSTKRIEKIIRDNDPLVNYLYDDGFLEEGFFLDTDDDDDNGDYIYSQNGNISLTQKGLDFLKNDWYSSFKESTPFQIIRDLFALAGGAAAIILAIMQIVSWFNPPLTG